LTSLAALVSLPKMRDDSMTIVVAALSARMIAEAAAADGFNVIALDLFGDQDTRRACAQWMPIGEPARMRIDADRLFTALESLAQRGDVSGWMAGSGFEGRADVLERCAQVLPLIGTQADAVRRVRDPQTIFAFLDSRDIAHPPVQMTAPIDRAGWLIKDANGSGGWQVRRASLEDQSIAAGQYFQRRMRGVPMSVTFIASDIGASILGFNEQMVRQIAASTSNATSSDRPFVFRGVIGPLRLSPAIADRITSAVREATAEFSLRGLCSMDFILDGARIGVLEINPRPPSSLALYVASATTQPAARRRHEIIAAHVEACTTGALRGELCDDIPAFRGWRPGQPLDDGASIVRVRGIEIIFAPHALQLGDRAASLLAQRHDCHDLPAAGTHFDKDDPVCSVSTEGQDRDEVHARLQQARLAIDRILETPQ
jgi:predicted ATP-grasp superfamily ATP-dependent carboligase